MKALLIVLAHVAYAALVGFVWLSILLSCGLGPDATVECNETADRQALWVLLIGGGLYAAVLMLYLYRRVEKR